MRTEGVTSMKLYSLSLAPGPYEKLRGHINETIQSQFSSGFLWELKGLHQWDYPYSELLSSHWLQYKQYGRIM